MGQFSRFVRPGARFLETTGGYTYPDGTGLFASVFVNAEAERVVVIQNKFSSSQRVRVNFEDADDTWVGEVPARSVVTWVV
jgi:O-glycosyl hydrolase